MSRRQQQTFNEINITPLTDIFLVLLIIMMVIAPMLDQQGLSLSVPSNQQVEKQEKDSKIMTINVSDEGAYSYEGEQITEENLVFKIKEAYKVKTEGLLIQAADNATHGAVVKLMDAARNAGVTNISITEM